MIFDSDLKLMLAPIDVNAVPANRFALASSDICEKTISYCQTEKKMLSLLAENGCNQSDKSEQILINTTALYHTPDGSFSIRRDFRGV